MPKRKLENQENITSNKKERRDKQAIINNSTSGITGSLKNYFDIVTSLPVLYFSDKQKCLLTAIEIDSPFWVNTAIIKQADINAIDPKSGYTPLELAIEHDSIACMSVLIDNKVDLSPIQAINPGLKDRNGISLSKRAYNAGYEAAAKTLDVACAYSALSFIKTLSSHNADIIEMLSEVLCSQNSSNPDTLKDFLPFDKKTIKEITKHLFELTDENVKKFYKITTGKEKEEPSTEKHFRSFGSSY